MNGRADFTGPERESLPVRRGGGLARIDLSQLLRVAGAGALLVAMYSFLSSGWAGGNDVARHFMMLGHAAVLAALGLVCGHWLGEGRGARLLLALALASVPVSFAILGAFIWSLTAPEPAVAMSPHVTWVATGWGSVAAAAVATAVILVPVVWMGFRVLVRPLSGPVAALFLMGNGLLLLPVRHAGAVMLLLVVLLIAALPVVLRARDVLAARTREGITALALLMLPAAILIARTLWLHAMNHFLVTLACLMAFLFLRQLAAAVGETGRLRKLLETVQLLVAGGAGLTLGGALVHAGVVPHALLLPLAGALSAGLMLDVARNSRQGQRSIRLLAVLAWTSALAVNQLLHGGGLAAAISLFGGVALMVFGYRVRGMVEAAAGLLLMLAGAGAQIWLLLHHFSLGSWAGMAAAGIAAILAASVLEARGGRLRSRLQAWLAHFRVGRTGAPAADLPDGVH